MPADDLRKHRLKNEVVFPGDERNLGAFASAPAQGMFEIFRRVNAGETAAEDDDPCLAITGFGRFFTHLRYVPVEQGSKPGGFWICSRSAFFRGTRGTGILPAQWSATPGVLARRVLLTLPLWMTKNPACKHTGR